jgi:hypothetical protein
MNSSATSMFLDPSDQVVVFIGGGGKSTLIHHLCRDFSSTGQKIAVISIYPSIIPMEANTMIAKDIKNLKSQIKQELKSTPVIYIGKQLENERLDAYKSSEISQIIKSGLPVDRLFIEADATSGKSVSGYSRLTINYPADRCINIMGADAFNKPFENTWIKSRDPFWSKRDMLTPMNLEEWMESREIFRKIRKKGIPLTFFLNKVENIFTQNLAHSFGKKIRQTIFDRVIIGSVFNSQFQLIE